MEVGRRKRAQGKRSLSVVLDRVSDRVSSGGVHLTLPLRNLSDARGSTRLRTDVLGGVEVEQEVNI